MELIIYGVSMCVAFLLGAYIKSEKKVEIKNPIKVIEQKKIEKEVARQQSKLDEQLKAIEYNIDAYNGTAMGQKEIPS